MHPNPHTRLRIGAFVVDPLIDEVSGAGTTSKLEPRATDVLVYLAQRPGEVVSVDLVVAWNALFFDEDGVPYRECCAHARRVGDAKQDDLHARGLCAGGRSPPQPWERSSAQASDSPSVKKSAQG